MRTTKHLFIAIAMICTLAAPLIAAAQRPGDPVPGRYIIQVDDSARAAQVARDHGLAPDRVFTHAVNGFAGFVPPGLLKALAADPAVLSIVPDRMVSIVAKPDKTGKPPKDDGGDGGGGQVVPAGVARIGADPAGSPYTGSDVGVAIVDTGIDFGHTDLNVAVENFSAHSASGQDDHGHGTHVAGIVAALNNSVDVVGVAPGATLYAVKVLNKNGSGLESDIIAGLDWIIDANAADDPDDDGVSPKIRVVNMSLGRPGTLGDSPLLHAAFKSLHAAGITVVVAAGNDYDLEVSEQVPATYPEVFAIASTTAKKGSSRLRGFRQGIAADTASYFTTDGAFDPGTRIGVTISAPGEEKEDVAASAFITSVGILSLNLGGGTTRMSGTSMASPHVAGVVARLIEIDSALVPELIRGLIRGDTALTGTAPFDSPTIGYTYDDEREGIVIVPALYSTPLPPPPD